MIYCSNSTTAASAYLTHHGIQPPLQPHQGLVTIANTGTKNSSSSNDTVAIDYATVTPNITTVDDVATSGTAAFAYGSNWSPGGAGDLYEKTTHWTATAGATATLTFTGTGAVIYGVKDIDQGIATYSVDGGTAHNVHNYSATRVPIAGLFTISGLPPGTHHHRHRHRHRHRHQERSELQGQYRTGPRNHLPIGHAVLDRGDEPPPRDDVTLLLACTRVLPAQAVTAWEFPADPAVVADARRVTRRQLEVWGLEDLAFTTELVVSELRSARRSALSGRPMDCRPVPMPNCASYARSTARHDLTGTAVTDDEPVRRRGYKETAHQVAALDADGLRPDQNLVGAGDGVRHILVTEHFGAAVAAIDSCLHSSAPFLGGEGATPCGECRVGQLRVPWAASETAAHASQVDRRAS
ncbi:hypothetical protein BX281_0540 [Streptomyces sp. Ag82_O1-15]|uniref:hypothetical protein n=1 Tax=Streptomyces sp. Ag82_O1-15 TaxID=1938855 RepID=UPI000BC61D1F|nr:hypothetical protein BX281_0540 [Streptomyces sp. Ag82_O1-15]